MKKIHSISFFLCALFAGMFAAGSAEAATICSYVETGQDAPPTTECQLYLLGGGPTGEARPEGESFPCSQWDSTNHTINGVPIEYRSDYQTNFTYDPYIVVPSGLVGGYVVGSKTLDSAVFEGCIDIFTEPCFGDGCSQTTEYLLNKETANTKQTTTAKSVYSYLDEGGSFSTLLADNNAKWLEFYFEEYRNTVLSSPGDLCCIPADDAPNSFVQQVGCTAPAVTLPNSFPSSVITKFKEDVKAKKYALFPPPWVGESGNVPESFINSVFNCGSEGGSVNQYWTIKDVACDDTDKRFKKPTYAEGCAQWTLPPTTKDICDFVEKPPEGFPTCKTATAPPSAPTPPSLDIDSFLKGRYPVPEGYTGPLPACAFSGTCDDVNDLLLLAINVGKWIFGLLGTFALVMFVYGGFMWVTSGGSPERVKQGRSIVVAAVVGLIIAFSAYILINFLLDALTVKDAFRGITG